MIKEKECRLRPLQQTDLETVLRWRNSDRIRTAMFHDKPISMEEHTAWFKRLQGRSDSQYFVFEYSGTPAGLVHFSDIDSNRRSSRWGFYIGEENAAPGLGSAMGALALDHAFGAMRLDLVVGEVLVENARSIAYHKKLGFQEQPLLRAHVEKSDGTHDVLSLALTAENWRTTRAAVRKATFGEEQVPLCNT